MWMDGWTDSHHEPTTRSSKICEVPDIGPRSLICKIFAWHRLTFVGLEAAEFENKLTIVVNCYYVESPTQEFCKTGEMNAVG